MQSIEPELRSHNVDSDGAQVSLFDWMFLEENFTKQAIQVLQDLDRKFNSAKLMPYFHSLAPFMGDDLIQKHLLLSHPVLIRAFFENGIYSLDKLTENDQGDLVLSLGGNSAGKILQQAIVKMLNEDDLFKRHFNAKQIKAFIKEVNAQPKDTQIIITKANKETIFRMLVVGNILKVGRQYLDAEERDFRMQCISDKDVLVQMITAINYIQNRILPDHIDELLGFIGAAAHEIHKRGNESQLAKQNPGIPWKEISFVHRIIIHRQIRAVKYLPSTAFSEGIYYDEELYKQGKTKIITKDLPQLREALIKITNFSFVRQNIPIATTFSKLYQFYYEECQLQFLRHASQDFLNNFLEFYDEALAPANLFKDGKYYQLAYLPLIIFIGEALKFLSPPLKAQFNEKLAKGFIKARDELGHPERPENKDKIEQITEGKMTILDLLGIDKKTLHRGLRDIHKTSVKLLKELYGYSFNVSLSTLEGMPKAYNKKGVNVDMGRLPIYIQRIFTAADNYIHMDKDGSFEELQVAFKPRFFSHILNKNDKRIEEFNQACITLLNTNNPQYHSSIDFLHLNRGYYLSLKAQKKPSDQEQTMIEAFEKMEATVRDKVKGTQSDGFIKLYYLYVFQDQYLQNRKQHNPDAEQSAFITHYELVWQNLSKYLCGKKAVEKSQKKDLHSLCTGYISLFSNFYLNKISYKVTKYDKATQVLADDYVSGYQAFSKDYDAIKKISNSDKKLLSAESEVESYDKFVQSTICKAKEALSTLDSMNFVQHLAVISRERLEKTRASNLPKQVASFFGSMASQFEITLGSLARNLTDNPVVSTFTDNKFIEFFKTHFQNPRGHIAHNQIADIGNTDYVEMLQTQRKHKHPVLVMQGISLSGIEKTQKGYEFSLLPRYIHPSTYLSADFLNSTKMLREGLASLFFNSKNEETLHCYIIISREQNAEPTAIAYLVEQDVADQKPDPEEIKRSSKFNVNISEDLHKEIVSKYVNKPLGYIFYNKKLMQNITYDVLRFFNEHEPISLKTSIAVDSIMIIDKKSDIVLSSEDKAAVIIQTKWRDYIKNNKTNGVAML